MIGVEWGISSFRAFRIMKDGSVRDRRSSQRGILNVPDGRFGDTLREEIGPWLAAGESQVLLCGPVGGRQGWKLAPHIPCPAGPRELAAGLVDIGFDWATVKLVPGVAGSDVSGVAELMRGEETQVLGIPALLRDGGLACLPGPHARWVRVQGGRIASFTTHMTGDAYAALRGYTVLVRTMRDGPLDSPSFDAGVVRSGQPGGLLHHVFGVRAQNLAERLTEAEAPAYLFGILVGHEVRAALAMEPETVVQVIGPPDQTAIYARAIAACGGYAERHDGEAVIRGLALIGAHTAWT
ncbi:2-dehydro-3-deoxygalactonokinase [Rhodopila sp.]|jgi:2-dehydro-3-deoxygalactonokinase|uniref:2-dehydro-3-deoxygalactonokinase n=1 Tax=Rhodopila sp. TaxID=2480087 RepID=UPI002C98418E|nr:2-dehydro-3-deoxygalactonokinase [Rhodopila sp.]HVZ09004.1 2-dehydro-3-deoxygalactonokinase [Rhodopila sp.]